jgi:mRNA-degrading endonuclease RelE of RelBE toxin-antitoxin system
VTWEIVVAGPAVRAIGEKLPEHVATSVVEFAYGPLSENPRRVGKPLKAELAGSWSARRGEWRIIYEIDDTRHVVTITQVAHRGIVYRGR